MTKTVVVMVDRIKEHPKYRRRFRVYKNYKAHVDDQNNYKVGDLVIIEETRPISKDKKWKLIKKV